MERPGSTAKACFETVTVLCEAAVAGTFVVVVAVVVVVALAVGVSAKACGDTKSDTALRASVDTSPDIDQTFFFASLYS